MMESMVMVKMELVATLKNYYKYLYDEITLTL